MSISLLILSDASRLLLIFIYLFIVPFVSQSANFKEIYKIFYDLLVILHLTCYLILLVTTFSGYKITTHGDRKFESSIIVYVLNIKCNSH